MDKSNSQLQDVSTSDIVLAAFLRCSGFSLDRIEKTANRGVFVFSSVDTDTLQKYDLGQALCEPQSLNAAIKSLTTATRRIV